MPQRSKSKTGQVIPQEGMVPALEAGACGRRKPRGVTTGCDMGTRDWRADHVRPGCLPRRTAVSVAAGPFTYSRRAQFIAQAARHAIPAIYENRETATAGGLRGIGLRTHEHYPSLGGCLGGIDAPRLVYETPAAAPYSVGIGVSFSALGTLHKPVDPPRTPRRSLFYSRNAPLRGAHCGPRSQPRSHRRTGDPP